MRKLSEIITEPSLVLDITDDVSYTVPPCDAATWIKLQELQQQVEKDAAEESGAGMSVLDLCRDALGADLYSRMLDDKRLTRAQITHCGMTAYLWQLGNHAAAELFWDNGGKAPAPAVAPAKTPSAKDGDAATTTPKRTSTSGTSSRKAPAKKAAGRSRKSSPTRT